MVAHPVPPAAGEENPEFLRRRLLQELSEARQGITEASATLREAGDVGARLRHVWQTGLPDLLRRHPMGWSLGLALAGFAASRLLKRTWSAPPRVSPPPKSGGKLAKQLLLSGAGLLLKPAVRDFVIQQIKDSLSRPKRTSRG